MVILAYNAVNIKPAYLFWQIDVSGETSEVLKTSEVYRRLVMDDFQFSQASLQAYSDCPRRFYLRYARQLVWPAIEAEPALEHERRMQAGRDFHRLIQQQVLGIPEARLARLAGADEALARWWQNYLDARPADFAGRRYPELTLSTTVAGCRLVAKYDLVIVTPEGRAVIFDWKTTEKLPSRRRLFERWQTRVYRFVLVRAGAHLNGGQPLRPEQVEMVYWFAEHPESPVRFPYDGTQAAADGEQLTALIAEIRACDAEADFPLTDDERRCRYCPYRSLCDRGQEAGTLDAREDETETGALNDFDLDFDQVAEIEF